MQELYRRKPIPKSDFNNALRHGCSPVHLLHMFRTPFLKNNSGRTAASVSNKRNIFEWYLPSLQLVASLCIFQVLQIEFKNLYFLWIHFQKCNTIFVGQVRIKKIFDHFSHHQGLILKK